MGCVLRLAIDKQANYLVVNCKYVSCCDEAIVGLYRGEIGLKKISSVTRAGYYALYADSQSRAAVRTEDRHNSTKDLNFVHDGGGDLR